MSMVFVEIHQFLKCKMAGENGGKEEESMAVEGDNRGLISGTPPRNAFLLTRCRSAPYRSSSLASKFWESAMEKTEEEEEVAGKFENLSIEEEDEGEKEVIADDNGGVNEGKCNESKSNGVEEMKAIKVAPLILTRFGSLGENQRSNRCLFFTSLKGLSFF